MNATIEGMDLTAECSRCGSDHMRPGRGYRLPLCLSCGTATDTPTWRDAEGMEVFITDEGEPIHVCD